MSKTEMRAKVLKTLETLAAEAVKRVDTPAAFVRPRRLQLVVVTADWSGQEWQYSARVSEYDLDSDVVGEIVVGWTGPNWKHMRSLVEASARRRTTDTALWEAAG